MQNNSNFMIKLSLFFWRHHLWHLVALVPLLSNGGLGPCKQQSSLVLLHVLSKRCNKKEAVLQEVTAGISQ